MQLVSQHLELLLKWNSRVNLTSITEPEQILTRHFGESLFAARKLYPKPMGSGSLIDLGSGAGFPGIPINIWAPELHVTLIESQQKKATFLREVTRALNLTSLDVANQRAEALALQADTVTLRAVEKFDSTLPIAANLVNTGRQVGITDRIHPGRNGDFPPAEVFVELLNSNAALGITSASDRTLASIAFLHFQRGNSVPRGTLSSLLFSSWNIPPDPCSTWNKCAPVAKFLLWKPCP